LSKTASANGARRQPTRWTRRRLGLAIGLIFVAGIVAAALDLRFVIGGAPRRVEPGSLLVLDAATMDTVRNVRGETGPPVPPVRGAGLVWTVDAARNRLIGTNPLAKRVVRDVTVGTDPVAAAVGYGAVWVANAGNGSVTRVPLAGDRIETIGLSDQPSAIATGAGAVWVVSERGSKVLRIDPVDKQVTKTVRLANPPLTVVARAGRVYLTIGD
jgi:hypothetical protein